MRVWAVGLALGRAQFGLPMGWARRPLPPKGQCFSLYSFLAFWMSFAKNCYLFSLFFFKNAFLEAVITELNSSLFLFSLCYSFGCLLLTRDFWDWIGQPKLSKFMLLTQVKGNNNHTFLLPVLSFLFCLTNICKLYMIPKLGVWNEESPD